MQTTFFGVMVQGQMPWHGMILQMGRPQDVHSPISSAVLTSSQLAQIENSDTENDDGTETFNIIDPSRRIRSRLAANIHALRIDVNTYLCHIRQVSVCRLSLYSLKRPIEVNTDARIRGLLQGQHNKAG
jgi:hypothetical protein